MPERDYSTTPVTRKLGAKPGAGGVLDFTAVDDDWSAVRFLYRREDR